MQRSVLAQIVFELGVGHHGLAGIVFFVARAPESGESLPQSGADAVVGIEGAGLDGSRALWHIEQYGTLFLEYERRRRRRVPAAAI